LNHELQTILTFINYSKLSEFINFEFQ